MRRRTRITAWVFGILGILGLSSMLGSTAVRSEADRFVLIACGFAITALWFGLLAGRAWAWRGILVVLPIQLLAIPHNAAGLPSASRSPLFFWTGMAIITGTMMGWEMFVLLTDPPRRWSDNSSRAAQGATR